MTLKEASEQFCISMERLTYYEENSIVITLCTSVGMFFGCLR